MLFKQTLASIQKTTKGDQTSLDLWISSLVQLWREPTK